MLRDYSKVLYESQKNGKLFCIVAATICGGKLQIERVDFEAWEYNRRNGQVEIQYFFNEANTALLAEAVDAMTSGRFVALMRKKFSEGCFSLNFFSNLRKFCDENNIHYDYLVWY